MPDFDLSVTICSWNTQGDLRACLASLAERQDECRFEVIVVDNNSEDGSPEMVAREFPWTRLFRMGQNLGFTGGQNFAMEQAEGKHVLLLNSDTIVHEGALARLLAFVEANPDVGIVGPKLLNSDGSLQYSARRFPNPVAAMFRNTPLGKLFPNNRFTREYLMADWDHSDQREVDWVSGAALLASWSCIQRVGLLDPAFFMYCEDVDYCFRCWKAGLKVVYYPDAVITHAIGRSAGQVPNRMIWRFHRSMLLFYRKNMLPQSPVFVRPVAYGLSAVAVAARASLFIAKNKVDVIRRRLGKA